MTDDEVDHWSTRETIAEWIADLIESDLRLSGRTRLHKNRVQVTMPDRTKYTVTVEDDM